jgi:protein-L-isoaspartate(D-aspartate) O-methyltransferase
VEGNGLDGLKEQAPFDVIVVGGSLPVVPETLKAQLAVGGRMIVVVGDLPAMSCKLIKRVSERLQRNQSVRNLYFPSGQG